MRIGSSAYLSALPLFQLSMVALLVAVAMAGLACEPGPKLSGYLRLRRALALGAPIVALGLAPTVPIAGLGVASAIDFLVATRDESPLGFVWILYVGLMVVVPLSSCQALVRIKRSATAWRLVDAATRAASAGEDAKLEARVTELIGLGQGSDGWTIWRRCQRHALAHPAAGASEVFARVMEAIGRCRSAVSDREGRAKRVASSAQRLPGGRVAVVRGREAHRALKPLFASGVRIVVLVEPQEECTHDWGAGWTASVGCPRCQGRFAVVRAPRETTSMGAPAIQAVIDEVGEYLARDDRPGWTLDPWAGSCEWRPADGREISKLKPEALAAAAARALRPMWLELGMRAARWLRRRTRTFLSEA